MANRVLTPVGNAAQRGGDTAMPDAAAQESLGKTAAEAASLEQLSISGQQASIASAGSPAEATAQAVPLDVPSPPPGGAHPKQQLGCSFSANLVAAQVLQERG